MRVMQWVWVTEASDGMLSLSPSPFRAVMLRFVLKVKIIPGKCLNLNKTTQYLLL